MGHQRRRHRRLVHADANAVTGDARLRDFEQRSADAVAVADADLVVGETLDGEVLADLALGEVVALGGVAAALSARTRGSPSPGFASWPGRAAALRR